jgi:hypothetical protein
VLNNKEKERKHMLRHFVEIEFISPAKNKYWLPLIVDGNIQETEEIKAAYEKALEDMGFKVTRSSGPQLLAIGESYKSKMLEEYIELRKTGIVETLTTNTWQIVAMEAKPELSFNDHLDLMMLEPHKYERRKLAEKILENKLPIYVMKKGELGLIDHLVINLVA